MCDIINTYQRKQIEFQVHDEGFWESSVLLKPFIGADSAQPDSQASHGDVDVPLSFKFDKTVLNLWHEYSK